MKKLMLAMIAFAISVPFFGQVMAGPWGEDPSYEASLRLWRGAQKLTILDKIPSTPHHYTECLDPRTLRDGNVGYLESTAGIVSQIIGPTDVLLKWSQMGQPVWIQGGSTKGLADGDLVVLAGMIKVDGTKSYEATNGAQKTVRVIRFLAKEEVLKIEAEAKRAAEAEAKRVAEEEVKRAAAEEALYRTWTDSTGTKKMTAKYLYFLYDSRKVALIRKNEDKGTLIPISQLSQEDQQWVREQEKRKNDLLWNVPIVPDK